MKSALVAAVAAAALLGGPALAAPAALAAPTDLPGSTGVSGSAACKLVAFDTAQVVPGVKSGTLTLVVAGTKSATNVSIELIPLDYFRHPEYWEIVVIGCTSGIGLPVLTPYTVKLDITHYLGSEGIEVTGANGGVKIPVALGKPRRLSYE